ncbi:unnamed protein product [Prorocentrum cordatum]|uniref:Uncharacterized protein n=1 Tax=Prorocentrum cordatum TaxID=2364126 RepID=A0ABN9X3C1_9DINO|nr:unnamed protein product [Polarella glacialis]
MTSVSQPARCARTDEPLMELVAEGVGAETGVVPLAVDGFDVTARLGSKLESIGGQQDVDHSGPMRGEGGVHCDGESNLEGLDVKKDSCYRQPLRGEGVGHMDGESKLEGIDVPKDIDHGEPLRGEGVGL